MWALGSLMLDRRVMKTKIFISVNIFSFFLTGCVPFASNEFNTKLWMSKEERIKGFRENRNYEIGKQFYSKLTKEELCKIQKCNYVSKTITEYVFEWESNTNPPRKCVYLWIVDASQSEKDVPHWRGVGLGKKIKWRYVSEQDKCLTGINFAGPW